jgi:hypothetical protein
MRLFPGLPNAAPGRPHARAVVSALLLGLGVLTATAASLAATDSTRGLRAPADWNGIWVLADTFMDKQDGTSVATPGRAGEDHDPPISEPKLKGQYLLAHQARMQAEAAGKALDDTGAACIPQGMPRFWHGPYAFEIIQTPRQVNIYQEWNEQTRRVYLDGRQRNPDADPTYNGHSIGHWQGRELLIDTAEIRTDSGLGAGAAHSDQIHITERIKQIAPDLLLVQMTVTDPQALAEPWISEYRLRRKPGMEIEEYVCAENNRNKPDENGTTRSGIESK